jgi:uncharacterized protein YfaS (alpha-2-macroglobulin family)
VFWQATLAGFDTEPPRAEAKQKLEVFREFQVGGKTVAAAKLGEELEVHLKIRSLGGWHANVAVVDLLPGGFEPVLDDQPRLAAEGGQPPEQRAEVASRAAQGGEDEGEGEEGDGDGHAEEAPSAGTLPIGTQASTWIPQYADVREDRVVLYGQVGPEAREFVYRVKATNRGTFAVPPPFAESMYDRSVKARGLPAQLEVTGKGE